MPQRRANASKPARERGASDCALKLARNLEPVRASGQFGHWRGAVDGFSGSTIAAVATGGALCGGERETGAIGPWRTVASLSQPTNTFFCT